MQPATANSKVQNHLLLGLYQTCYISGEKSLPLGSVGDKLPSKPNVEPEIWSSLKVLG
jgi:hypothetical protein